VACGGIRGKDSFNVCKRRYWLLIFTVMINPFVDREEQGISSNKNVKKIDETINDSKMPFVSAASLRCLPVAKHHTNSLLISFFPCI